MSDAGELEAVAEQLRRISATFTTAVNTLRQQTYQLDGAATDLTTGTAQWAGKASLSFLGAWSQYHQDTHHSADTLEQTASSLSALAQTIEDNVPAIRIGQQAEQQAQAQGANSTLTENAMQAMQTAEFAIAMMAASMSAQLEELTPQVGHCSEPQGLPYGGIPDDGVNSSDNGNGDPEAGGSSDNEENDGNAGAPEVTTPEGRRLTKHSQESVPRHKMTPKQVDDVIDNPSRVRTQRDGATVYIKSQLGRGRKYSIVIEGTDGIVTAMRDLDPVELARLGRRYGFDPNP